MKNHFPQTTAAHTYMQWHERLKGIVEAGADPSTWRDPEKFRLWLCLMDEAMRTLTISAVAVQCFETLHAPAEPSSSQPS